MVIVFFSTAQVQQSLYSVRCRKQSIVKTFFSQWLEKRAGWYDAHLVRCALMPATISDG